MLNKTEKTHRTEFCLSKEEVGAMVYEYLGSIGENDFTMFTGLRITSDGGCVMQVEKSVGIVPKDKSHS